MTPRQRYNSVFEHDLPETPARIPILMQFAAEYIGSTYGEFASDHRKMVEANIRCAEDFGMDQVSSISDPYRETEGFGAEILYHENMVPECVSPPVKDLEDVPDIPVPDPMKAVRMRDRIDAVSLYRKRCGDHYSILGWAEGPGALACDLYGISDFLMDLMDEPGDCEALMDLCVKTSLRFARCQVDEGADTIGVGDAICSQISPELYEAHIFPFQQQLIEGLSEMGARVRLHICGQTRHLWPKLKTLPLAILDCDHMVDMKAARAEFPAHVVLAGNHDPVSVMRFGTPEMIREKTRLCREEAGGKFMINAGCEIPSGTPEENLKALCAFTP